MSNVVELDRKTVMTAAEILAVASRQAWRGVVVLGYQADDEIVILPSDMTNSHILWLLETAKHDLFSPPED